MYAHGKRNSVCCATVAREGADDVKSQFLQASFIAFSLNASYFVEKVKIL